MNFSEDKNKEAAALLYIFAEYPELECDAKTATDENAYFKVNQFQEYAKKREGTQKVFAKLAATIFKQGSFPLSLFNSLSDDELKTAFEAIKHCKDDKAAFNLTDYERTVKENAVAKKPPREYLGQTQVASLLQEKGIDLDKRKVAVYYKRGHLPSPTVMLGKTPGWKKEVIEKWIEDYKTGKIVARRKR